MPEPSLTPLTAHTVNRILGIIRDGVSAGEVLLPKAMLARHCGTSRTTVQESLDYLRDRKIVREEGRRVIVLRSVRDKDFVAEPESLSQTDRVEQKILEKFQRRELGPGQNFSELDLAREFGVTTVTVREALLKLARLGIFRKEARKQWEVIDTSEEMLEKMLDLRDLLTGFAIEGCVEKRASVQKPLAKFSSDFATWARAKSGPSAEVVFRAERDLLALVVTSVGNPYLTEHFELVSSPVLFSSLHREPSMDNLRRLSAGGAGLAEAIAGGDKSRARSRLLQFQAASRKALGVRAAAPANGSSLPK